MMLGGRRVSPPQSHFFLRAALNYIGSIERGEKLASLETVVRLARAFKMTGGELLTRSGI